MSEQVVKQIDATELIQKFHDFFQQQYYAELVEQARKGCKWLNVQFPDLIKFDPDIADALLEQPEEVLKGAEIAIEQFDVPGGIEAVRGFAVRFFNLPASSAVMIRNIRSNHLGKFLLFDGVVRQKSDVRPQVTEAKFECPSCGNTISMLQLDNKFKEPTRCSCGRKGKFRLLSKVLVDAQGIVLEEAPEQLDGGEQPKRMNVFLKNDLVSPLSEKRTNPGSRIHVIGLIKEVPIITRSGAQSTRFDLLIEANSVTSIQEEFTDIQISPEDEQKIKELAADPALTKKLVNSMAPSIYGHDMVKEALLLQLMGGVRKKHDDGVVRRGDIHILLVGDPGAAKSQLLKRMNVVAPKARYVTGKGASGAGLSATVVKDEFLQGWSLEAGALVLANKGLCLTGDTNILLADGTSASLKDVYEQFMNGKNITVQSLDTNTFNVTTQNIVNVSARIPDELLEITLDTGDVLRITPEHPLPLWNNGLRWTPAGEVKPRCALMLPTRFLSPKSKGQEAFLELCGMVATDGHLSKKKYQISYYSKSDWLIKRFQQLMARCFGRNAKVHRDSRGLAHAYANSKEIHAALRQFVPAGKKHGLSATPLLNHSHEEIKAFLIGAINGDGSVSNRKCGGLITLITASPTTAETYRALLRRIGIISHVRSFTSATSFKSTNPTYHVCVSGRENMAKLWDTRLEPARHAALEGILLRASRDGRIPSVDTLFSDINAHLSHGAKQALYASGIKISQLRTGFGVRRATLQKALDALAALLVLPASAGVLQNVATSDTYFGTITRIKKITPETVYNLQTDAPHDPNYIANFVPVHNCCIDEMDKMKEEDGWAMHEALEQQSVTISKANIQASLRCETTVLAAANPKFGRFDPYDTVANQIDLPPTLINRFDLIFAIKDTPDAKKDEKLAAFMLELHKNNIETPPVDTKFLRKYIAYAKKNITPTLTDDAIEELKEYFIKMRSSAGSGASARTVPISARQLEGLVRLSEGHAKMHLRDKVTKKDAKRAIDLLDFCLRQVAMDEETGQIDIDRIATGMPASQRNKIMTVKEVITELENKLGKTVPIDDVIREATAKGLNETEIEDILQKLKKSGDIFEPRHGFVSRI